MGIIFRSLAALNRAAATSLNKDKAVRAHRGRRDRILHIFLRPEIWRNVVHILEVIFLLNCKENLERVRRRLLGPHLTKR